MLTQEFLCATLEKGKHVSDQLYRCWIDLWTAVFSAEPCLQAVTACQRSVAIKHALLYADHVVLKEILASISFSYFS